MNPVASQPATSAKTGPITRPSPVPSNSAFRNPQSAFASTSYFILSTLRVKTRTAFTLIELLVVITIIIILMGLLFPAFRGVQDQAKRTQAKNDLTQIVTAVNAYYTEYGRYPTTATADITYGPNGSPITNETLMLPLLAQETGTTPLNTRQIQFLSPPSVKDPANPRSGLGTSSTTTNQYFDPWGRNYAIRIDADYNNQVANPYGTAGAGADPIRQGVIAWSLAKDGAQGIAGAFTNSDDVISWQ